MFFFGYLKAQLLDISILLALPQGEKLKINQKKSRLIINSIILQIKAVTKPKFNVKAPYL